MAVFNGELLDPGQDIADGVRLGRVFDGSVLDPGQDILNGVRTGRVFVGELLERSGGEQQTYYYRVGDANAVATTDPATIPPNGVIERIVC